MITKTYTNKDKSIKYEVYEFMPGHFGCNKVQGNKTTALCNGHVWQSVEEVYGYLTGKYGEVYE